MLTLDWVDGISIREKDKLIESGKSASKIASDLIQHFLRQAVRDGFFMPTCTKEIFLSILLDKLYL